MIIIIEYEIIYLQIWTNIILYLIMYDVIYYNYEQIASYMSYI